MALAEGTPFGPYTILGVLGEGGMATVYRAFQPSLRRTVAIKVIGAHLAAQPDFRARFRREAAVLARLEHPNILLIYDYGEVDGQAYIVYRYVSGGTLAQRLTAPLSVEQTVRLLAPVADALDFAHRQGVVHRDIKPGNILLTEDETPIVADFGLARLFEIGRWTDSMLVGAPATRTGVGLGTPLYMAPEQVQGRALDGRTDQYSLGVMAYEMLTGSLPFAGETPLAVALKHINEPPPLPRSINPYLSQTIDNAISRTLAKPPAERFATCGELITALANGVDIPARDLPPTLSFTLDPPPDELSGAPNADADPATTERSAPRESPIVGVSVSAEPAEVAPYLLADQPTADRPVPARRIARRRLLAYGGITAGILIGSVAALYADTRHHDRRVRSGAVLLPPVYPRLPSGVSPVAPSSTMITPTPASPTTMATLPQATARASVSTKTPRVPSWSPNGVAVDGSGVLYVACSDLRIRTILSDGSVATLAGSGISGFADGDGGSAAFALPHGLAVGQSRTIYVADGANNRIRAVTPDRRVTTFAGSGTRGFIEGQGPEAEFDNPIDLAIDVAGILYVVDSGNYAVRKVTPDGTVSTLAGSGEKGFADGQIPDARFNTLSGVAVDLAGVVYVADEGNHRIRKIAPDGNVTTLAGSGRPGFADGDGATAQFNRPAGVAVDHHGTVYVADWLNSRIRKVMSDGAVSTLAISGTVITFPSDLAIDESGTLYVVDSFDTRLIKVAPDGTATTLSVH